MKDERVYIAQMLDAIAKAEAFVSGVSKEYFEKDQKTQSAVILQLMIIGEISKKVSEETKRSIDIPWKDVAGFRDVAIHNYFSMDLDIVWNTLQEDLPPLKEKLSHALNRMQ